MQSGNAVRINQYVLYVSSFLIVAFAQPDWGVSACILASCIGYALFWKGLLQIEKKKTRFYVSVLWFALVESFHLNWFLADRYVGFYIYPFFLILVLGLGVQFGIISLFIPRPANLGIVQILGISGGWTLLEWSRLFLLSGFSWDPVGLALSSTLSGMQAASIFGIYGLSFWVFSTNLFVLRAMNVPSWGRIAVSCAVCVLPYIYGMLHIQFHQRAMDSNVEQSLSALLVQTAMIPDQKQMINGSEPFSPAEQWERILKLVAPYLGKPNDLIVLSEGVVPYGTHFPIYSRHAVEETYRKILKSEDFFPQIVTERVGNSYWAQSLSNVFNASVLIGLEDADQLPGSHRPTAYNAALLFSPFSSSLKRYEKRVLVPMGEYIPFNWCKKILSKYGILGSFEPGKEAKVFQIGNVAAGISVCYEETYGHLMRENRKRGAEALINITNDVWYPRSRLPMVHFLHARLRAVEAGVPILRACNTGVTCCVDALGRTFSQLPCETVYEACQPGVLSSTIPIYHFRTFYTFFGDILIVSISSIFFVYLLIFLFFKRKRFVLNDLNIYHLRKN